MATQDVYFRGIKRKSDIDRLKESGITDDELKAFGYKSQKEKKKKQKKPGLLERLKMGITGKTSEKNLSPAGREYRRSKKDENKGSKYKRSK